MPAFNRTSKLNTLVVDVVKKIFRFHRSGDTITKHAAGQRSQQTRAMFCKKCADISSRGWLVISIFRWSLEIDKFQLDYSRQHPIFVKQGVLLTTRERPAIQFRQLLQRRPQHTSATRGNRLPILLKIQQEKGNIPFPGDPPKRI